MKLTLEVPTAYLEFFSRLTDLDFCLAQVALEESTYAEFFKKQAKAGRMVLMDNGFHEMGRPLSIPELEKAVDLVTPSLVIAPDILGKPLETHKNFEAMYARMHNHPSTKLAVVMAGNDMRERGFFFENVRKRASMICLPFREDRRSWFKEMVSRVPYSQDQWPSYIHLLGMNEFEEAYWFRKATQAMGFPHFAVSIDTAKPIKWGLQGELMFYEKSPRGSKTSSATLHKVTDITTEQMNIILNNLAYLRRWV